MLPDLDLDDIEDLRNGKADVFDESGLGMGGGDEDGDVIMALISSLSTLNLSTVDFLRFLFSVALPNKALLETSPVVPPGLRFSTRVDDDPVSSSS